MPKVECAVIEDDNLSATDKAAVAFVAIQVKELLDVALAIAHAGKIKVDVNCQATLNDEIVVYWRTKESDQ